MVFSAIRVVRFLTLYILIFFTTSVAHAQGGSNEWPLGKYTNLPKISKKFWGGQI